VIFERPFVISFLPVHHVEMLHSGPGVKEAE
jgi:hypothetical protein